MISPGRRPYAQPPGDAALRPLLNWARRWQRRKLNWRQTKNDWRTLSHPQMLWWSVMVDAQRWLMIFMLKCSMMANQINWVHWFPLILRWACRSLLYHFSAILPHPRWMPSPQHRVHRVRWLRRRGTTRAAGSRPGPQRHRRCRRRQRRRGRRKRWGTRCGNCKDSECRWVKIWWGFKYQTYGHVIGEKKNWFMISLGIILTHIVGNIKPGIFFGGSLWSDMGVVGRTICAMMMWDGLYTLRIPVMGWTTLDDHKPSYPGLTLEHMAMGLWGQNFKAQRTRDCWGLMWCFSHEL